MKIKSNFMIYSKMARCSKRLYMKNIVIIIIYNIHYGQPSFHTMYI